jgi:hypothetical protein
MLRQAFLELFPCGMVAGEVEVPRRAIGKCEMDGLAVLQQVLHATGFTERLGDAQPAVTFIIDDFGNSVTVFTRGLFRASQFDLQRCVFRSGQCLLDDLPVTGGVEMVMRGINT